MNQFWSPYYSRDAVNEDGSLVSMEFFEPMNLSAACYKNYENKILSYLKKIDENLKFSYAHGFANFGKLHFRLGTIPYNCGMIWMYEIQGELDKLHRDHFLDLLKIICHIGKYNLLLLSTSDDYENEYSDLPTKGLKCITKFVSHKTHNEVKVYKYEYAAS